MKEYTPVAMRCTREQFESIKHILIDNGIEDVRYDDNYDYISIDRYNSFDQHLKVGINERFSDVHEIFCAQTFLNHYGIEAQPKDPVFVERYNITDKVKELLKECKEQGFELNIDNGVIILKQI